MNFFKTLNYTSCNEDPHTELKALDVSPGDKVACITGSGDRPLHMLLGNPSHVYAFDSNEIQNFLLEFKIEAIKKFNYDEYVQLLGLIPSSPGYRIELYNSIEPYLSEPARDWFNSNMNYIANGILYSGRWERYFKLSAFNMQLWRGKKIKKLFACNNIEEQREFLHTEWDTRFWRLFLLFSFNRFFFRWIFGDPGFYTQVESDFSPGKYIYTRLRDYMEKNLAIDSFMLALVFYGKFFSERHYPAYLNEKNFALLKKRIHAISIHTMSLDEMLDSEIGHLCNKFSLSDVSSFLDNNAYTTLFKRLAEVSGRRFCLRDFLTNRSIPKNCPWNINFLYELQDELVKIDRSIGYTFIIGETIT